MDRGGADPAKVREALRGGFAESRILDLHGRRMVERDFETKGRSVTHLKDLDNAIDAAGRLTLDAIPYTNLTADLFRGLIAHAGDLDHSGLGSCGLCRGGGGLYTTSGRSYGAPTPDRCPV